MDRFLGLILLFSGLIATAFCFFWPLAAWLLLSTVTVYLLLTLIAVKRQRYPYVPDLHPLANQMLQKYGHFYFKPFAGKIYSGAASANILYSIIMTVICIYQQAWWGIIAGLVNGYLGAYLSKEFNPSHFEKFLTPAEQLAHQEIVHYIVGKDYTGEDDNLHQ